MINVLIPITVNNKKYKEILLELAENENINLLVGVSNQIRNEFGYLNQELIHIYDDSFDKESILNALFTKVKDGSVVVMRQPITIKEFDKMVNTDEHIATCRKERNTFMSYVMKVWQKILKMFLGVNLYSGDTAVVYFSEVLLPVLFESKNLSYASRVDRWIGVEKTTVNVNCQKEKYSVDKKAIVRYSIFADVSLLVACLLTTLLCVFVDINVILGLLLFCVDAICLSIILISIILIIFNCQIGKKNVDNAIEIGNIYKNEEEGE